MSDRATVRVNGASLWLWCPGCQDQHRIIVSGSGAWEWDGNEEMPTISPSLLVNYGTIAGVPKRCHSFVRAGRWEFLTDCTHQLAGQTVPMVPRSSWWPEDEA